MKHIQHLKVGVDGLGALDMHDRGDPAGRHGGPDICHAAADAQCPLSLKLQKDIDLRHRHLDGMWPVKLRWQWQIIAVGHHRGGAGGPVDLQRRDIDRKETAGKTAGT